MQINGPKESVKKERIQLLQIGLGGVSLFWDNLLAATSHVTTLYKSKISHF